MPYISLAGNLEHFYIGCYARTEKNGDEGTRAGAAAPGNNMSIGYCRNLCAQLNTTFAALTVISIMLYKYIIAGADRNMVSASEIRSHKNRL